MSSWLQSISKFRLIYTRLVFDTSVIIYRVLRDPTVLMFAPENRYMGTIHDYFAFHTIF